MNACYNSNFYKNFISDSFKYDNMSLNIKWANKRYIYIYHCDNYVNDKYIINIEK